MNILIFGNTKYRIVILSFIKNHQLGVSHFNDLLDYIIKKKSNISLKDKVIIIFQH